LMPYGYGMSGLIYLSASLVLNSIFMVYAVALYRKYSDALSRSMFRYSILYLSLLFAALLVDHYWYVRF
jgi:heme o synthase